MFLLFSFILFALFTMKEYLRIIYLWLWFTGCRSNSNAGFKTRIRETYPELYSNHYQGDIFFFDEKEAKNAVRGEIFRWPNGTIPYVIGSNFTEDERGRVLTAMNRLQNETCVKFSPRKYERNYIFVDNKKGGCYAVIGYHLNANKPHPVNLESPGCLRHQGTIEHELLHIMGLYHEQSRVDRDEHVIIYWGNITDEYKSNFEKASDLQTTSYNIPYDTNSVMHYPRYSFSKNGQETIVSKKDPEMKLGQRVGAAPGDLDKIRKMYNCNNQNKPYGSPDWFLEQINKFFNDNSKNGIL